MRSELQVKLMFDNGQEIFVDDKIGLWRGENDIIFADDKEVGKNGTVSGLRNGTPAYNFWIENNELIFQAISSKNTVKTPAGKIKNGTIKIKRSGEIKIGRFEFFVQTIQIPKESEYESITQKRRNNHSFSL